MRRIRRYWMRHKWIGFAIALLIVVVAVGGFLLWKHIKDQESYEIVSNRMIDVGKGYREIEYQGKTYSYNNRVTSILYAGVDADGDLKETAKYTMAPRADSISLVVMDEYHKRTTVIALSRDTITPIHKFTLNGRDRGLFADHLCWAYTYGNGGKVSCDNLCQAVSDLLFGIPINGYVISGRASIPTLAEVIGPVEVVVPNSDLYYRGFAEGQTVVIDRNNLETFVRYRDTGEDNSNVGRMERQKAYIEGAMTKLVDLASTDPSGAWERMQTAEGCVRTDITRNRYLDLARVLKNTGYSTGDYYIPEGEQVVGLLYDEFHPDLDKLHEKVIELFYIEQ